MPNGADSLLIFEKRVVCIGDTMMPTNTHHFQNSPFIFGGNLQFPISVHLIRCLLSSFQIQSLNHSRMHSLQLCLMCPLFGMAAKQERNDSKSNPKQVKSHTCTRTDKEVERTLFNLILTHPISQNKSLFLSLSLFFFSGQLKTCKKQNPKRIKHYVHCKTPCRSKCNSTIEEQKIFQIVFIFFKKCFRIGVCVCSCCIALNISFKLSLEVEKKKVRFVRPTFGNGKNTYKTKSFLSVHKILQ